MPHISTVQQQTSAQPYLPQHASSTNRPNTANIQPDTPSTTVSISVEAVAPNEFRAYRRAQNTNGLLAER